MRQLLEFILFENEKEDWFEERTNKHIELVKKAAAKIVEKYSEFAVLVEEVKDHDASKFLEPERTPYIELTWQHKTQSRKYETPGAIKEKDINDATLYHIKNNKHHPEYWNKGAASIDPNDRDKSIRVVDVYEMSDIAIAEMVADWVAMGWELKNNARDWYNKQKGVRWNFNEHQDELIDKLLAVFETREPHHSMDMHDEVGEGDGW